jgi:hypothetical protein
MSNPRINYTPRAGATSEAEVSVLAAVYRYVLRKKEAAHPGSPDDAKERSKDDSSATRRIP